MEMALRWASPHLGELFGPRDTLAAAAVVVVAVGKDKPAVAGEAVPSVLAEVHLFVVAVGPARPSSVRWAPWSYYDLCRQR